MPLGSQQLDVRWSVDIIEKITFTSKINGDILLASDPALSFSFPHFKKYRQLVVQFASHEQKGRLQSFIGPYTG